MTSGQDPPGNQTDNNAGNQTSNDAGIDPSGRGPGSHIGELRLRRFRIGDLHQEERATIARHTADCGACRSRLASFDDEQRAFEQEIAFLRFAGGVERAARVPRAAVRPRRLWLTGAIGFAAAGLLLLVRTGGPDRNSDGDGDGDGGGDRLDWNRRKGPPSPDGPILASIRIAAAGGSNQRSLLSGSRARLRPGDRLRLGYRLLEPRHLAALSVDDRGRVTPLYPEKGTSLAVAAAVPASRDPSALVYLPDSVELTGAGLERIYLFAAEQRFSVDDAVAATRAAFAGSGARDLASMTAPALAARSVEVLSWLFEKP